MENCIFYTQQYIFINHILTNKLKTLLGTKIAESILFNLPTKYLQCLLINIVLQKDMLCFFDNRHQKLKDVQIFQQSNFRILDAVQLHVYMKKYYLSNKTRKT